MLINPYKYEFRLEHQMSVFALLFLNEEHTPINADIAQNGGVNKLRFKLNRLDLEVSIITQLGKVLIFQTTIQPNEKVALINHFKEHEIINLRIGYQLEPVKGSYNASDREYPASLENLTP